MKAAKLLSLYISHHSQSGFQSAVSILHNTIPSLHSLATLQSHWVPANDQPIQKSEFITKTGLGGEGRVGHEAFV